MAGDGSRSSKMKTQMFRTSVSRLAGIFVVGAVGLALTSCFYMPGVSGRPAKAGISVNKSLLPANLSSIAVIVGGPGMETIVAQYSVGTTTTTLTVPSGVGRTFTLLANTESVTFRDDVTVDLAPDETKQIDLTPTLFASQIVVPDYSNSQVVQISDMKGTGWQVLGEVYPHDIDFDNQGRMYVASSNSLIQMEGISGNGWNPFYSAVEADIISIAMDRTNDLLYWAQTDNTLWRALISSSGEMDTPVQVYAYDGESTIYFSTTGIAVDQDGFVYIANNSSSPEVLKINPNPDPGNAAWVASYSGTLYYPYDVLVNGDYVYVSDPEEQKIIRLTKDLQSPVEFFGPGSDPFLGPERFVATMNRPITLIDETSGYPYEDRLVSFGDITGAGWTTYGSTGPAPDPGLFQFLYYYNP
jgi:hypothetical protein